MERIPVSGPWITDKEVAYVAEAARHAWYANANAYNTRFEEAFAKYQGARYAISLPSCTSAIHLSLLALGIGPGDEVIVPDVTWIASAAPIHYVGAQPVFADIDEKTWCLSADSFADCITPRTRAVIPVGLYGGMADMARIRSVAESHGIAIVEDAAESLGAEYQGRPAGSFGDTGVFSFHGSKTLTTGEGGMLVTNRDDLWERALFLRDHGRRPGDRMFYNSEVAFKYKMSSMQAALGLAQLERIEELMARKRQIFSWYRTRLGDFPGLTLNDELQGVKNAYWMVTIILDPSFGLEKAQLMALLSEQGIDTRPFFHPLSSLPAYRNCQSSANAQLRNATGYRISRFGINLPSGLNLDEAIVERVAQSVRAILGSASNRSVAA